MMACVCGEQMQMTGMGSRRVEGEHDLVHTTTYRCPSCGRTDFTPKMAVDEERHGLYQLNMNGGLAAHDPAGRASIAWGLDYLKRSRC